MWKNSLKNVESDNNNILYETLPDFFFTAERYILSEYPNCKFNSLTDRLFCSVLLPLFTVVGMDRCEEYWYASYNLRGTPRGSRNKPNASR